MTAVLDRIRILDAAERTAAPPGRSRRPVSASSVAIFRIVFGLLATITIGRFFTNGWIRTLYVAPEFHYAYPGFGWVQPLPEVFMYALFVALGAAALGITIGYRYRLAAAFFAIGFGYVELIDQTLYLNHYYWMVLTAGLMAFLPLDRMYSVRPGSERSSIAVGVVWILRGQLAMVYVFAGLAKLNADWLVLGEPLATWLPVRSDLPLLGPLLPYAGTAIALSWAGAIFDLTIVGWLLWHRTRPFAYVAVIGFHVVTWLLFPSIGMFPWLMIGGTLVFFPPDWPLRVAARLGLRTSGSSQATRPVLPVVLQRPLRHRIAVTGLALYAVAMIVVPMRQITGPGDTAWTGRDAAFSWRVMLTEKAGTVDFRLTDVATGATWVEPPPGDLTDRQVAVMSSSPELIRETAKWIAAAHADDGRRVSVSADAFVTINGRPHARILDPTVDLTRPNPPPGWILPRP